MKTFKKVFAVAIVIALFASIAIVPANAAADPSVASIKVKYTRVSDSESVTSATAGDFIDVSFAINSTICVTSFATRFKYDFTQLFLARQNATAYDSTKVGTNVNGFKWMGRFLNTAAVAVPGDLTADEILFEDDAYGVGEYLDWGSANCNVGVHVDATPLWPASWSTADKAQYKMCMFSWRMNSGKVQVLCNTHGADQDIIRFRFYALSDIANLNDVISVDLTTTASDNYIGYDGTGAFFATQVTTDPLVITAAVLNIVYPTVASGPAVASAATDIKCRWQNNDTTAKLQLGILGTISGTAITATSGVANELTACGVLATGDSTVVAADFILTNAALVNAACGTIYDQGDGTYKFRAVMDNVPYDASATVYYRTYATISGVTYYSDIVSTTGAAQYARAIAASPALAAYTGA